MQTKGTKSLKIFPMTPMGFILKELIEVNGGKAEVCRRLGVTDPKKAKGLQVKLGHYEKSRSRPKANFINQWEEVFGDDLLALEKERNVSRGTKKETNLTPVIKQPLPLKPEPQRSVDHLWELSMTLMRDLRDLKDEVKELKERVKGRV